MCVVNRILPYRRLLWSLVILKMFSGILVDEYAVLFPYGNGVGANANCPIPDLCVRGYAPRDIRSWYEAIGRSGRFRYLQLVAMDFLVLMPMYAAFLFLELRLLLATARPSVAVLRSWPSFLPVATVVLDVIETGTHGYGVARLAAVDAFAGGGLPWPPLLPPPPLSGDAWLTVASMATQTKFWCLGCSVGVLVVGTVLNGVVVCSSIHGTHDPAQTNDNNKGGKQS